VPFFPVRLRDLPCDMSVHELTETEFDIGPVHVRSRFVNHPGNCVGYRLDVGSGSVAFLPDHEPYEFHVLHAEACAHASPDRARKFSVSEREKLVEFLDGVDILFLDAQYNDDEYKLHKGWGHGSITTAVDLAADAKVGKLMLFHHDPNHDDDAIDRMLADARKIAQARGSKVDVDAAREGMKFAVAGQQVASNAA
jgi:phosphoribosyl 1,2-cyclic phosphodiesterase